jgi:Lipase (class 3)
MWPVRSLENRYVTDREYSDMCSRKTPSARNGFSKELVATTKAIVFQFHLDKMPSGIRYITKDSHPILQKLSEEQGKRVQGRRYDSKYASQPGGIRIEDLVAGVKYACISITDDHPGTLLKVGKANPWYLNVMKMILGSKEQACLPLTTILQDCFALHTVDHIINISGISNAGHALDTQGYIAHNDTTIVLAYRCTTSAKDWITNLTLTSSAWDIEHDVQQGHSGYFSSCADYACCGLTAEGFDTPGTSTVKPRVHTGFYNNFLVTVPAIRQFIDPLLFGEDQPPRTLYVVGHSLGAGIAMMGACHFLVEPKYQSLWRNPNLNQKLRVVTVGGPRACCQSMQERVDAVLRDLRSTDKVQVAQLVRDKDCVPHMPHELFGFRHLREKVIFISKEDPVSGVGHIIVNPDPHQVIQKKQLKRLLEQNPKVLASFDPNVEDSFVSTHLVNDGIDIAESSSDTDEDIAASPVDDTERSTAAELMDDKLSEAEWLERYEKNVKRIPRAFRDHMPDFYLKPLMHQLAMESPSEIASFMQSGVKSRDIFDPNVLKSADMDETSTASEDDDVPYQPLYSGSAESSVIESRSKKKSTAGVKKGLLGGMFRRNRCEKKRLS